MIRRTLRIGRWLVYFFFVTDDYERDTILSFLYTFDAQDWMIQRADDIMTENKLNRGFTFSSPELRRAVVVIGPSSSGAEFLDSFTHEVRHLANAIAESIGYELDAEEPSYMTGDTVRELAEVVCELGCARCRG